MLLMTFVPFQTFIFPLNINNLVLVQGNLHATGEIDEGIFTNEVVTLSEEHTITAPKHFQDDVIVKGKTT